MKTLFILVAGFFLLAQSFAQEVSPENQSYISLGMNISSASGIGLSFRTQPSFPLAFVFTGGVIKTSNQTDYTVGTEIQFSVLRGLNRRLFITTGAGYYYDRSDPLRTLALGFGAEGPISGKGFYKNLTMGLTVNYPAMYFTKTTEITFGAGVYAYFNF